MHVAAICALAFGAGVIVSVGLVLGNGVIVSIGASIALNAYTAISLRETRFVRRDAEQRTAEAEQRIKEANKRLQASLAQL